MSDALELLTVAEGQAGNLLRELSSIRRELHRIMRERDELLDALALVERRELSHIESAARAYAETDGYCCGHCGSNIYAQNEALCVHRAMQAWREVQR